MGNTLGSCVGHRQKPIEIQLPPKNSNGRRRIPLHVDNNDYYNCSVADVYASKTSKSSDEGVSCSSFSTSHVDIQKYILQRHFDNSDLRGHYELPIGMTENKLHVASTPSLHSEIQPYSVSRFHNLHHSNTYSDLPCNGNTYACQYSLDSDGYKHASVKEPASKSSDCEVEATAPPKAEPQPGYYCTPSLSNVVSADEELYGRPERKGGEDTSIQKPQCNSKKHTHISENYATPKFWSAIAPSKAEQIKQNRIFCFFECTNEGGTYRNEQMGLFINIQPDSFWEDEVSPVTPKCKALSFCLSENEKDLPELKPSWTAVMKVLQCLPHKSLFSKEITIEYDLINFTKDDTYSYKLLFSNTSLCAPTKWEELTPNDGNWSIKEQTLILHLKHFCCFCLVKLPREDLPPPKCFRVAIYARYSVIHRKMILEVMAVFDSIAKEQRKAWDGFVFLCDQNYLLTMNKNFVACELDVTKTPGLKFTEKKKCVKALQKMVCFDELANDISPTCSFMLTTQSKTPSDLMMDFKISQSGGYKREFIIIKNASIFQQTREMSRQQQNSSHRFELTTAMHNIMAEMKRLQEVQMSLNLPADMQTHASNNIYEDADNEYLMPVGKDLADGDESDDTEEEEEDGYMPLIKSLVKNEKAAPLDGTDAEEGDAYALYAACAYQEDG